MSTTSFLQRLCVIGGLATAVTSGGVISLAQDTSGTTPRPGNAAPAAPERKVPDTLMFSIDEYNEIQSRLAGSGDGSSDLGPENISLYLSTILYYGPRDWTIWINGVPMGPDADFQSFQVTGITPGYVDLLVPLSAQGMKPVRLGPNQTFVAKSGVVVEGQTN